MNQTAMAAIVGYVVVQFIIGAWVSRRMVSDDDYILAGRSLGTGLVAFSVFATWFGAEAVVASAGEIYDKGLTSVISDPFGYGIAVVVIALLLAAPLWRRGLTTYADLLRIRYSPAVEKAFVFVLLPGSVFWAAAQIRSFGQIMSSTAGIEIETALLVAATLVAVYSVVGGLLADAITDVVQGLVVIVGLIILGVVVAGHAGGVSASLSAVPDERLDVFSGGPSAAWALGERLAIVICGSIVSVELISRFLGARSVAAARNGTLIGGILYIAVGLIPAYLGLVGPSLVPRLDQPEQIVPRLAELHLPGLLYPLFIGAQVSAILSVVHAALHAPASQVSHNVVTPLMPQLTARGRLTSVRIAVLGLSIMALLLAQSVTRIKELVETASAFGSSGAFVVAMFALFTRFGGPAAALSSLAAGIGVWVVSRFVLGFDLPYLLSIVAALTAYVGAAAVESRLLLTPQRTETDIHL